MAMAAARPMAAVAALPMAAATPRAIAASAALIGRPASEFLQQLLSQQAPVLNIPMRELWPQQRKRHQLALMPSEGSEEDQRKQKAIAQNIDILSEEYSHAKSIETKVDENTIPDAELEAYVNNSSNVLSDLLQRAADITVQTYGTHDARRDTAVELYVKTKTIVEKVTGIFTARTAATRDAAALIGVSAPAASAPAAPAASAPAAPAASAPAAPAPAAAATDAAGMLTTVHKAVEEIEQLAENIYNTRFIIIGRSTSSLKQFITQAEHQYNTLCELQASANAYITSLDSTISTKFTDRLSVARQKADKAIADIRADEQSISASTISAPFVAAPTRTVEDAIAAAEIARNNAELAKSRVFHLGFRTIAKTQSDIAAKAATDAAVAAAADAEVARINAEQASSGVFYPGFLAMYNAAKMRSDYAAKVAAREAAAAREFTERAEDSSDQANQEIQSGLTRSLVVGGFTDKPLFMDCEN
jgi:hypothetical protein